MKKNTNTAVKTNVDSIIRKIVGASKDIPFAKLPHEQKKAYWNVATVFRSTNTFGRVSSYKSGKGLKLIEKFVMSK